MHRDVKRVWLLSPQPACESCYIKISLSKQPAGMPFTFQKQKRSHCQSLCFPFEVCISLKCSNKKREVPFLCGNWVQISRKISEKQVTKSPEMGMTELRLTLRTRVAVTTKMKGSRECLCSCPSLYECVKSDFLFTKDGGVSFVQHSFDSLVISNSRCKVQTLKEAA